MIGFSMAFFGYGFVRDARQRKQQKLHQLRLHQQPPAAAATKAPEPVKSGEKVTVNFWNPFSGNDGPIYEENRGQL